MRRRPSDEDLFADSTMTFGEHLEELRVCLFKSILGLVAGFLIGLLLGSYVVAFIQTPLEKALAAHYEAVGSKRVQETLEAMRADGESLPATPEEIAAMVGKEHLLPEEFLVDPRMVLQQLKDLYPEQFKHVTLPEPKDPGEPAPDEEETPKYAREGLVRVFLWHATADDSRVRAKGLSVQEAFSIWVKASLLVGVILASPYIFYQIWSFVAAGLYPHEKRYVHVFLPFSLALFLLGAATAFFFVFEPVLTFLFTFNRDLGIDIDPRISEWLGFVLILPLGFGISFQLPLVMLFLERIGIFDVPAYLSRLRLSILVIFFISMILTPADPYSMMLMAVPLTFLYFVGILLCKLMPRSKSPYDE